MTPFTYRAAQNHDTTYTTIDSKIKINGERVEKVFDTAEEAARWYDKMVGVLK